MNNRSITESELMNKLKGSRKILEKLEGTTPQEDYSYQDYSYDDYEQSQLSEEAVPQPVDNRELAIMKIQNSGLPEAVKRAMIESPIAQPTLVPQQTFSNDFLTSAKRLMNEDSNSKKKLPQKTTSRPVSNGINIKPEDLVRLISETVEKVLEKKLGLLAESQKSEIEKINETLVLKVGNTIFKGKITEAKNVK